MVKLRNSAGFPGEAFEHFRGEEHFGTRNFDRDFSSNGRVDCAIDDSKSSSPQNINDLKTIDSGWNAALIGREIAY
jgi:hypothetical protein